MLYLTGLALVTGMVIGLVRGGRFRDLARRRIRGAGLVAVGFGLQLATDRLAVRGGPGTAVVLAGAAALLAFAALNPNLVGIGVVAVGVAANALVIGANDGMPVRPDAVVAAHIVTRAEEPIIGYGYRHHREGPGDHLRPLGDIIPIPPFREVVSFGDLILAFGVAATLAGLLQPGARHTAGTTLEGRHRTSEPNDPENSAFAPQNATDPASRPTPEPNDPQRGTVAPEFPAEAATRTPGPADRRP